MAATVLLVTGLSVSGFIWFLALQLRIVGFQVLYLNARQVFPDMDEKALRGKISDSGRGGGGDVGIMLHAHCKRALRHYVLACQAMWFAPSLALGVAVVWRFMPDGSLQAIALPSG